ncbi:hypothetical protein F4804DRAFT_332512 [Jackrogersella minutella]|nr:hypothetical protein F4804DRAFT_332512 [Jackrogersella minutella]
MEADHIDKLLERYLHLLNEYTTLRDQLNTLQTGIYQNIARANFAGERGMRFGQDHYDERTQASRKVAITTIGNPEVAVFAVAAGDTEAEPSHPEKGDTADDATRDAEKAADARTKQKDPLRWFGLFTPVPLRQAQAQSIEAVEQVIPKLVSVNAQMAQVEIEVRRARKRRAKAEVAAAKKEQDVVVGTEVTV